MAGFYDRYKLNGVVLDKDRKHRYVRAGILPTIDKTPDDTYIITTIGDTLDFLAFDYYKDVNLWWLIAAANPDIPFSSLYLEPGIQIRIPPVKFQSEIDALIEKSNRR